MVRKNISLLVFWICSYSSFLTVVLACRNAFIVNEFKVDLHGMHIEEAHDKVQWVLTGMREILDKLPCESPPILHPSN